MVLWKILLANTHELKGKMKEKVEASKGELRITF